MKRILIAIILAIVLMVLCVACAQGEKCRHDGLTNVTTEFSYKDVEKGHVLVYTQTGDCPVCGKRASIQVEGGLTGHVFCMSESIHFDADGMHLWVFICMDCHCVTLREEPCGGNEQCLRYTAQAGMRAPVYYGDSLAAWHQQTTTEDYVQRWIAQNKKEEPCTHENMTESSAWTETVVEAREAGHVRYRISMNFCKDCSQKIYEREYDGFQGHVFHMAESIHFSADGVHLWVFICPECMYTTMREEPCAGGDQCLTYNAQAGERPAVQLADSLAAWKEANQQDDIVQRWIAQNGTE